MFKNKIIAILGLGASGKSAYRFFKQQGFEVLAFDDNESLQKELTKSGYQLTNYRNWNFALIDFIIVSPGINIYKNNNHHFIAEEALKNNVNVGSDIELLMKMYPNKKYVGVTGTNGKSTTTALIEHGLKLAGFRAIAAGNIGVAVFDFNINDFEYIILELSSYQLSLMSGVRLECAIFLNLSQDHLDYHGSFEEYELSKLNIFQNQTANDVVIIDKNLYQKYQNHLIQQKVITVSTADQNLNTGIIIQDDHLVDNYFTSNQKVLFFKKDITLRGLHNYQNIACAYSCLKSLGIDTDVIKKSFSSFQSLAHRQEFIRKINNINFINDSKATNQESTLKALHSYSNIVLILGGVTKEDNLDSLIETLKKLQFVILIGSSKKLFAKILDQHNINYKISSSMEEAVNDAYNFSKFSNEEINILLSPACSSFDEFKNFEERGEVFKKIVNLIK